MAGFIDRDGGDGCEMKAWLRKQASQFISGTAEHVEINRYLDRLTELVEFRRGYQPALLRKDEIIQELRDQVERLEKTAHTLRQARGGHAGH